MDIRFDTYYDNDELQSALEAIAAAHPELVTLSELGRSHEGRPIPLVTLAARSGPPVQRRPAFWVDGNIHATELTASMAALYVIADLAGRYGTDAAVTRMLDRVALYVVPRLNPDGAAMALANPPRYVRSGTRPYPHDEPQDGLHPEDIDGDGRILQMRVPDPTGDWKISDHDERLMVKRAPDDMEGDFFRIFPEGLIENYDGHLLKMAPPVHGLDFNRNFPSNWRPEGEQYGAGDYPGSEPEIQAVLRFFADHPTIFGALTFHTYSRAILRPFSSEPDDKMNASDKWVYDAIGQRGTEITGYPNVSVYHHFRYHPQQVITGVFDDWLYTQRGIYAFTVELWDLPSAAGITEKNEQKQFIEWMRSHPVADDIKIFDYVNEVAPERVEAWRPFDHPQLGPVEIGGFQSLYTWRNPPPALLEEEIAPQADFVLSFASLAPEVNLRSLEVAALGEDTWRVLAVVENSGFLSTSGSRRARDTGLARPVRLELRLPEGGPASIVGGDARVDVGHLEGRCNKMASGWFSSSATDNRGKAEWLVRAPSGTSLTLRVDGQRGGRFEEGVVLGG